MEQGCRQSIAWAVSGQPFPAVWGFQDLLAAIDILVISSRQKSFGLTAIEALAMETPDRRGNRNCQPG
jgi:hypothetical protein